MPTPNERQSVDERLPHDRKDLNESSEDNELCPHDWQTVDTYQVEELSGSIAEYIVSGCHICGATSDEFNLRYY